MAVKSGQVSVFIIIGIVIVASFILVSFVTRDDASRAATQTERSLSTEDRNVRAFAETCVAQTAKKALFYLGFIGGDVSPDSFPRYFVYGEFGGLYKIPYFYFEEENEKIPIPYNERFWARILSRYMDIKLNDCIEDFKSFKGVQIGHSDPQSAVEFTDKEVIFNVKFPVSITRDFQKNDLDEDYISKIPVRLRDILQISTTIVGKEVLNDQFIHWDYLTQVSERNYNITAYTESDNTIIYRIIDLENKIDNEPYLFQFANKIRAVPIR